MTGKAVVRTDSWLVLIAVGVSGLDIVAPDAGMAAEPVAKVLTKRGCLVGLAKHDRQ